jgi:hypothetical protein
MGTHIFNLGTRRKGMIIFRSWGRVGGPPLPRAKDTDMVKLPEKTHPQILFGMISSP